MLFRVKTVPGGWRGRCGAVALAWFALAHAESVPLATVKHLDAQRYLGKWHQIALYPNFFQRMCARDTSAEYSVGEGGAIVVRNRCINAEGGVESVTGVARRTDPSDPARLEVRFAPAWLSWLPIVWGKYWVIGLADDYRYAVVGEPGRDYLWVLARATRLSREDRIVIDELLRASWFDPQRLVETPHSGAAQ